MSWQFANPWMLLFALAIPAVWIFKAIVYARHRGMMSPVPSRIAAAGRSARTITLWVPAAVLSLSVAGCVIALARPQEVLNTTKSRHDTIALELVIDRSGSMNELVNFEGEQITRLEAVKYVLEQFVVGDNHTLGGREGDLLGLIVFGSFADTLMPLTQSHEALVEAIRLVELPRIERERSTAIGDALMLATARLKASEDSMRNEMDDPEFMLKSKAIILLTDGENSAGVYSPQHAAALAKDWGIKVYIIGIRGGTSMSGIFGGNRQSVNDRKMTKVAEYTGGQYWGVDRASDLGQVYAQIDELERSSIEISEAVAYRELYFPFAFLGLCAYVFSTILRTVVYRSTL